MASKTAPSSPIGAGPPTLPADPDGLLLAAVERSSSSETNSTEDTHVGEDEDETSSAPCVSSGSLSPPPKVIFNESVKVRFIPNRLAMAAEGTLVDTYWSPSDFREFRRDFVARARSAGLLPVAHGAGACILNLHGDALLLTVEPEPVDCKGKEASRDGVVVGERGDDVVRDDGTYNGTEERRGTPQAPPQVIPGTGPEELERRRMECFEGTAPCSAEGKGGGGPLILVPRSSVNYTAGKTTRGCDESERGVNSNIISLLGRILS